MSCIVEGCAMVKRFKPKGITFHRLPKGNQLKRWLQVLGRDDQTFVWSENKMICSKHFQEDDFIKGPERSRLKPNAVPSLHLRKSSKKEESTTLTVQSDVIECPHLEQPSSSSVSSLHLEMSQKKEEETIFSVPHDIETSENKSQGLEQSSSSFSSGKSSDDAIKSSLRKNVKRHIGESSGQESSKSSSSGKRRKTAKLIQFFHNYSVSPGKYKRKYIQLRKTQMKARQRLYASKKTIKKLKKKITTLETVVEDLKRNQNLSENAITHLNKCYEDIPHVLMHRYIKNAKNATTTRESYPEKLRNFACTLHFYSSKAYEYVRRTFALALPHASVIRKWCANVSCDPGFCDVAFEALKQNVEKARNENKEVICSLLLDEMAIKKHIQLEGKKAWGYVDVGVNVENFDLQPASDVLVLMVVCHNSHWKIPIAYFFIKGLSGLEKANLVNEALIRLHEVKVVITSVTFDGPSAHFSMLKELGCSIDDVYNMKTWFSHPSNAEIKVFCILDVCHMLKLIRNLLGSLEKIHTRDGIVDWTYIKKLYELQDRETLKLANKLKKSHLEWQKQKMKVNLAAEVFSSSIANALEFLHTELQHPDFKEVEPTISFIRRIDSLFDILNSRTPWAKEFKAPLRENNEHLWRPFLLDTCQFLLESTDIGGRPLYLTPRKTPILGFVISICSVQGIFDAFVKNNNRLNYILTHKCSQDHLEIFFSSIRSRNGWNNNPSALQFMHTFKRLLLFSRVSERGGNCKVLDDTIILTVPSTQRQRTQINNFDVSIYRRYNLDMIEDAISDHDYDVPHLVTLNEFTSNVVTYMSGYVVKMLKRTIRCPECMTGCIFATNEIINVSSYRFLLFKNRGGLQIPSEGVVKICETTEKCVRRFMTISNNSIPKNVDAFVIVVAQQLYDQSDRLFPSLMEHSILSPPNEESHMPLLIKNIINCYCKIRFYNLAKTYTQKIQGVQMRQTLTKLILFNHQ